MLLLLLPHTQCCALLGLRQGSSSSLAQMRHRWGCNKCAWVYFPLFHQCDTVGQFILNMRHQHVVRLEACSTFRYLRSVLILSSLCRCGFLQHLQDILHLVLRCSSTLGNGYPVQSLFPLPLKSGIVQTELLCHGCGPSLGCPCREEVFLPVP